jgi:hypothetical protein
MNTRFRLVIITLGALVVLAAFTYPRWRPLFVNTNVEVIFPGLPTDMQDDFLRLPREQQRMLIEMRGESQLMAIDMARALISADISVDEAMPDVQNPVRIGVGAFIEIDMMHSASGTAIIYRLPDDRLMLRLEGFRTTKGPELHVVLSRAEDPREPEQLGADYRDLGRLKGNVGNQNYDIPSDLTIENFNSVVIYSVPYQVIFSTATLE